MKILVIDDNAVLARSLARMLRSDQVAIETDSPSGLARVVTAAFDQEPFDVVLCDLAMPAMTGTEVLAGLRALDEPPILILMTGYDHVVGAALADSDGVLAKPFTAREVHDLIAEIKTKPPAKSGVARPSACG